jgi:nicotinamidase-related amidase
MASKENPMSTPLLSFDTAHAAVLSMDLQTAIVSIYAKGDSDLITRAANVLREAREHRLTAIHVQVGFRPGLPEISLRNPLLSAIKNSVQQQQLFQGAAAAIHPAVEPQQSDIVITKYRISAFSGTDLDMILWAKDIDTHRYAHPIRNRNKWCCSLRSAPCR